MDKVYNFYNIEASFRIFLTAGKKQMRPVTIKNYLSDLRHFLGWLVLRLKSNNIELSEVTSESLSQHLTKIDVAQYRAYLQENNAPTKTINRRLSTLRKFCSFCVSQQWMAENPAKDVRNIIPQENKVEKELGNDLILVDFKDSLKREGLDLHESQNITQTIKEFLLLQV